MSFTISEIGEMLKNGLVYVSERPLKSYLREYNTKQAN